MTAETAVEYMPAVSLNRLQARLDGIDAAKPERAEADEDADAAAKARRQFMPWQGLMAASVAVIAVALSFLAGDRWQQYRARAAAPPAYYTVTTAVPRAPDEAIRAVFSPTITLSELQSILDEAQLRIVSGPTEAGVYSLAAKSRRPVDSSLALLRSHAQVRFAESTTPARIKLLSAAPLRQLAALLLVLTVGACGNTPVRIESGARWRIKSPARRITSSLRRSTTSPPRWWLTPAARLAATTPSRVTGPRPPRAKCCALWRRTTGSRK